MEKQRFSLLLLDPGEYFFEDFSAVMVQMNRNGEGEGLEEQLGRVKMCSKSIVFDPKDFRKPLLKIPLRDCSNISELDGCQTPRLCYEKNAVVVKTRQYIEMLEGNVIAPYKFISTENTFIFVLNYVKVSDCLPHLCQLHRASGLPVVEQNSMIAAIVFSRQARVPFDPLWLDDLNEEVKVEVVCCRITPLVSHPGRIIVTNACLCFQPFSNVEQWPVLKVQLRDIRAIVKRRFLLRQTALEVYCRQSCSARSVGHVLLSMSSERERDLVHDAVCREEATRLEDARGHAHMTLQWQNGVISNYEYLQYLNSVADRTYNDLTQYPVFPWVLNDYSSKELNLDDPASYRDLSKPIGALNDVRLRRLKERYDEMPPPKFLYGSHYSAPGFVLFYLVRKYPHYMLCLQNGRFDHPDRMFNSVADVWRNVLTNMADFKELTPEFFDVDGGGGDFCNNVYSIDFGRRHDGSPVGDVELPPWARDAKDFVGKMRSALESEHVSSVLHLWIDLIFGYKQRGEEAVKADNVFFHLCYEGALDLDAIADPSERHALEVQIMEFGQIPKQLFCLPHPCRGRAGPQRMSTLSGLTCRLQPLGVPMRSHRATVMGLALLGDQVLSVALDSVLRIQEVGSGRQVRSAAGLGALSACLAPCADHLYANLVVAASRDNTVVLYDVECGRVAERLALHPDAISCLSWAGCLLATGSWDGSVRLWRLSPPPALIGNPARALVAQLDHEARVTCIDHSERAALLASGTEDGDVLLWSLVTFAVQCRLEGHSPSGVTAVRFSADGARLVSCGMDSYFRVFDLSTRMQVYCRAMDEALRCLAWDSKGQWLLLGGAHGTLFVWDVERVEMVHTQTAAHQGAVSCVAISADGSVVVSGGEDQRVQAWNLVTSSAV
ncbi:protein FAN-like [Ischnura elegans]|uniref:protein FAN-like n=1 Tax=Ischnura elegans TaxID=197161 RepID=UPI001ED88BCF|nr:protein FAN-like [Ischnura elegans]